MKLRTILIGILIAATCQTAVLGKIIYDRANALENGREALLETGFIDPRDLFRGHYTTLNLLISNIQRSDVELVGDMSWGDPVFVELDTSGDFAKPTRIHRTLPKETTSLFLKGTAQFSSRQDSKNLRITFPFNRFYAAKTRALELQNMQRQRKLGVILSISDDGTAMIKGLTIEGKKIYEEPLY